MAANANNWHHGAQLVQLASVDAPGDAADAGTDGRRAAWMALVAAPDGSSALRLQSRGSAIVSRKELPTAGGLPALARPAIDSPAALQHARAAEPNLAATAEKSVGFHFVLQGDNAPAMVRIDPASGTVAEVSVRGPDNTGGLLYSPDGGTTWQASNLTGRMVTSAAADPQQPRAAWAATAGQTVIGVYQTTDGGRTWTHVSDLPAGAGNWPFGVAAGTMRGRTTVAVGTREGVWLSTDGGRTWSQAGGLPADPAQFLAVEQTPTGATLHVTIGAGTNAGEYRSTDLRTWERVGSPARLSQVDDLAAVAAVHEPTSPSAVALPVPATLERGTTQRSLTLPPGTLRLAGSSAPGQALLIVGPTGVQRSTDGGVTWQRVLNADIGTLGVAPDSTTSGVAVAGGSRNPIFRTNDGGQTWAPVLKDASKLVPGTNELPAVVFTSPSDVIVVQGGSVRLLPQTK